ncbi:diguanylate cyclase [Aureimonas mangrovi]|uniref:diguanylate cyclase n=1 Tax=Aureimonas mangrovi TaxID=2758041 RepID=UPI00163DCAC8|nr:diguanylate cyclase [Aureimonas mangrovi]
MANTHLLASFFNGLGLMALVAVLYGTIQRLPATRLQRAVLHGLVFGGGAIAAMMTPTMLLPGVIIDVRTIMVGMAAAFVGPVAAVITGTIAAAYRIALGGSGVPIALGTLLMSLTVGLVWRQLWFKRHSVTALGLFYLGLGLSLNAGFVLVLLGSVELGYVLTVVSSLAGSALFATQVLGAMMTRENKLIAREKALADDALTDPLTRLPNRRAFDAAEKGLRSASWRKGFTLMIVDVDHFKSINDRYGHDVGDTALCVLAETLRASARVGDVVARFGGEEFVVALPDTHLEEGRGVAERILTNVRRRHIALPDAEFGMTVSIGIAHTRDGEAIAAALTRADAALYRAKAEGRDRAIEAVPQISAPTRPSSAPALGAPRLAPQRAP